MVTKGVRTVVGFRSRLFGWARVVTACGPDVSRGVTLSGFSRVLSVGLVSLFWVESSNTTEA